MKHNNYLSGHWRRSVLASATLLLAACGGGSGSDSSTSSSTATPSTMTGTVAVGSAVSGANVMVIDANGKNAAATSDSSGNYTASVSGLSAPFLVVATDPTGVNPTLVSVLAALPTGTTAPAVANVTTLTTAVAALLTTSGNPLDLSISGNLTAMVSASSVSAAVSKLDTALASILTANGLSATSFDPIGGAFVANQTGADAVIESVQLLPDPAGGTQLISNAASSTGIGLSQSTTVSTPLSVPPAAADYLSSLTTELGSCLAGNSTSCAQAVDANYLENGYTTLATAHATLASSGVTLGSLKTLEFFDSSIGTQQALVAIPYTTSSGTAGTNVTVVQKTASGTWDIIGNQQRYNITITSELTRRQFFDTADAAYSRYDSGLGITIPIGAAGTPNPSNLESASVTGPGIHGTAYLVPRNAAGSDTLGLRESAYTAPPTGNDTTDSNTSLYRWSWQALPGATATYTPPSGDLGYYTPAPIDVSTVPQFATYTVTFYDSTGTQIGQPVSVINATPTLAASAGAGVAWQTLASSVQSDFLNPAGTQEAAQTSTSVSWSNLVNSQNLAPLVTGVQIQSVPGTGVTPTTEIDGWSTGTATFATSGQYSTTVTAGIAQNGVQACSSACQFAALQTGASRLVQLNWNVGNTAYYNIWKYND